MRTIENNPQQWNALFMGASLRDFELVQEKEERTDMAALKPYRRVLFTSGAAVKKRINVLKWLQRLGRRQRRRR